MTHREKLTRQVWRLLALPALGFVMAIAGAIAATRTLVPGWSPLVGFALAGIGVVLLYSKVRCPGCDGALSQLFIETSSPWYKRARFCPYCGLDLDTPLDVPVISER